jgi:hypothetical protein
MTDALLTWVRAWCAERVLFNPERCKMSRSQKGVVERFVIAAITKVGNVVTGIGNVIGVAASCVVQVVRNAVDAVYTDRERAAARDIGRMIGNAAVVVGRAIRTAAVVTGQAIERAALAVAKVVAGAACEFASDVAGACVEFARDVVGIGHDTLRCVRFLVAVVLSIDFRRDPNAPPVDCDERGVPYAIPVEVEEPASDDEGNDGDGDEDRAMRRAA